MGSWLSNRIAQKKVFRQTRVIPEEGDTDEKWSVRKLKRNTLDHCVFCLVWVYRKLALRVETGHRWEAPSQVRDWMILMRDREEEVLEQTNLRTADSPEKLLAAIGLWLQEVYNYHRWDMLNEKMESKIGKRVWSTSSCQRRWLSNGIRSSA